MALFRFLHNAKTVFICLLFIDSHAKSLKYHQTKQKQDVKPVITTSQDIFPRVPESLIETV